MKSYTDLEQSKKLAEILPVESADHHYVRKTCDFLGNPVDGEWSHPKYGNPNSKYANYMVQNFTNYETIPCWSLATLIEILSEFKIEKTKAEDGYEGYYYFVSYKDLIAVPYNKELIDGFVEMIVRLKNEDLL